MKLTFVERWMLSNQYRILAKVEPESAEYHERQAYALERGYEIEYLETVNVCDESEVRSVEECNEVRDILDMFRALKNCFGAANPKPDVPSHTVTFRGFDGNHEWQFGYGKFLKDQGLWAMLDWGDDGNSHCPVMEPYRHMLAEWKKSSDKWNLTNEDIIRIARAWRYDE